MNALWACPEDGSPLALGAEEIRCSACGRAQRMVFGVLDFRPRDSGAAMPAEPFGALREALGDKTGEERENALAAFCAVHGYRRTLHGGDWKLLLPVEQRSTVLEIGPGLGEITTELASRAHQLVTLAANPHAASLVQSQIVAAGSENILIGCTADLKRLPLIDSSIDSIAISESGLRGFSVNGDELGALAAELRRVGRPGATLLIGQSNPFHRLPGVGALRVWMKTGLEHSLDAAVQQASIPSNAPRWSRSAIITAMTNAGFREPKLYAPIPDEQSAMAVLPVADRTVVRYFLDHLVRRNALQTRVTLAALKPIVALGQFWRVVPYWYLVFES